MLKSVVLRRTFLPQAWVKNVYSLCVDGVVTRAQSYTGSVHNAIKTFTVRVQPIVITNSMDSFTPSLYTANFSIFNLLTGHLYTLSTVPTIKKIKKK